MLEGDPADCFADVSSSYFTLDNLMHGQEHRNIAANTSAESIDVHQFTKKLQQIVWSLISA